MGFLNLLTALAVTRQRHSENMREYIVKFWWYRDLRMEETVKASDELRALAKALDAVRQESWVADHGFRVEVILKQ